MSFLHILGLARKHLQERKRLVSLTRRDQMLSSAQLCLDDAKRLWHEGRFEDARRRAAKSLAYSVGISHPDYLLATK